MPIWFDPAKRTANYIKTRPDINLFSQKAIKGELKQENLDHLITHLKNNPAAFNRQENRDIVQFIFLPVLDGEEYSLEMKKIAIDGLKFMAARVIPEDRKGIELVINKFEPQRPELPKPTPGPIAPPQRPIVTPSPLATKASPVPAAQPAPEVRPAKASPAPFEIDFALLSSVDHIGITKRFLSGLADIPIPIASEILKRYVDDTLLSREDGQLLISALNEHFQHFKGFQGENNTSVEPHIVFADLPERDSIEMIVSASIIFRKPVGK